MTDGKSQKVRWMHFAWMRTPVSGMKASWDWVQRQSAAQTLTAPSALCWMRCFTTASASSIGTSRVSGPDRTWERGVLVRVDVRLVRGISFMYDQPCPCSQHADAPRKPIGQQAPSTPSPLSTFRCSMWSRDQRGTQHLRSACCTFKSSPPKAPRRPHPAILEYGKGPCLVPCGKCDVECQSMEDDMKPWNRIMYILLT